MIAPLAALNRGFSKKRMSSIGCGVCSSQAKNATSRTMPMAKPARIGVDVQPLPGASMIAHSSEPSAAIDRTAPSGSSAACSGSRDSGIRK